MKTISIANQKGGVGKTTTAINLGASLAAAEIPTLLVDCDAQANATSGLGVASTSYEHHLYHALIGQLQLSHLILPTEMKHLSLLPSHASLIGAQVELMSETGREKRLAQALSTLNDSSYEYVLLDCPPSLGLLTLNALSASDSVLIPLQCEYYALEGLSNLLNTIKLVRARLNANLALEGILLTMFDSRNNLSRQVELEVRRHFHHKVFQTRIPRNVRLGEAPSHGKPVLLYDITCTGSKAYLDFAEELVKNHGVQ